jgi:hypothetical protein
MKTAISVTVLLVVALVATMLGLPKPNPLGLRKGLDKLITRTRADGTVESLVVIQLPPGNWKPVDTLSVKRMPKLDPNYAASGIEFTGELCIYPAHPLPPGVDKQVASANVVDSFTVTLPTEDKARMTLIAGGAKLPLKTERLKKIPPWVPGQPPALPGVAWRAFEYEADTLTMFGYNDDNAMFVGHLELRAAGLPVRQGYWHSFGPAQEIQKPVAARTYSSGQLASR